MSGRPIPSTWDDVEKWLRDATLAEFDPVPVAVVKPKQTGAYECIVIRADLQQRVTQLSRYVRIGVQGWSVNKAGESRLAEAKRLAADFGAHLEVLLNDYTRSGPFLAAEVDSGPVRVKDSTSGLEYAYLTVLAEVHAA